jgi:Skp family chaperone for outer membrane proteins
MTMHRNTLLAAALSATLLVPAASALAQAGSPCTNGRVALVNSQRILGSIPEYVQADSLLGKDYEAYRADLAKQQAAFDSARVAYSDRATLLTAAQKAAEVKKLQDQNDNIQKHMADLEGKMQQRRAELEQPILTRVQDMLDGLRAELNCAIIFDVAAQGTQSSGIASADKSLDLTDRLIERLKVPGALPAKVPPKTPPASGGGIKPPGGGGGEPPAATSPAQP